MNAPLIKDQLAIARNAKSLEDGVRKMNSLVTNPCPNPKKLFGLFPRRQHHFEDYTSVLNTMTYTTLSRCRDCGIMVLGSGL